MLLPAPASAAGREHGAGCRGPAVTPAEQVADLVHQLTAGWDEHVDYQVLIQRHGPLCRVWRAAISAGRRKHYRCECPQLLEGRGKSVRQPPLIDQLQAAVAEPTANGTGEGGAGDKPHSATPGNAEALELLLRIRASAHQHYRRLREELYPDHTAPMRITVPNALRAVTDWCAMASDGTVECGYALVCEVKDDLRKTVKSARIVLGYDAPQRMLADTVCGVCAGALIVADDASTDVRCIGTPEAAGCGTRYMRWDWINLLEGEDA